MYQRYCTFKMDQIMFAKQYVLNFLLLFSLMWIIPFLGFNGLVNIDAFKNL